MIFFKRIFAVFLFGVLIHPVISMERQKHEEERHEMPHDSGNTPHVSFHVVNSTDRVEQVNGLTQGSPVVTGAVRREGDGWSLALGRTYIRRNTLMETLEENGLGVLRGALEGYARADLASTNLDEEKPKDWQVLYLVRKEDTVGGAEWLVEGIGFIKGPWNRIPREEIRIPYIVTGRPEYARSCINHLESGKIKFVRIEVDGEQLKVVRQAASNHYPRFLCMADINVCFAGHSGLCRIAWGTTLNHESGFPDSNFSYYGFTILGNELNPNTGSLQKFTALQAHNLNQYNEVELKLKELGFKITPAK